MRSSFFRNVTHIRFIVTHRRSLATNQVLLQGTINLLTFQDNQSGPSSRYNQSPYVPRQPIRSFFKVQSIFLRSKTTNQAHLQGTINLLTFRDNQSGSSSRYNQCPYVPRQPIRSFFKVQSISLRSQTTSQSHLQGTINLLTFRDSLLVPFSTVKYYS